MKIMTLFIAALILLSGMGVNGGVLNKKKWLVVENKPSDEIPTEFNDFPRLLLMQISKAGMFRCVDRTTYRTQTIEQSLGGSGEVNFISAGYCISWVVRMHETVRGQIVTASIGYNNIGKDGNNELINSEDVVVFVRSLNGVDIATKVAMKAAKAILFNLMPPQVIEVEQTKTGKRVATVDYGKEFLKEGDRVCFVRKKVSARGKIFSKKVGDGVVSSVSIESATIGVLSGDIKEDDYVSVKEIEDKELSMANLCPKCDGMKKIRKEEKCAACNGHGFTRIIKQRSRRWRDVKCVHCFGRGILKKTVPCLECNGTGK